LTSVAEVVTAIRAGGVVVIPTDTVYGLACAPDREKLVLALSRLKGRSPEQPIALLASSIDSLLELVPELREQGTVAAALLPGPYTLVLPNPGRRFPWLTGARPDTIGVRVPDVEGVAHELLEAVGVIAATSANTHGGPDPRRLDDVPPELLAAGPALDGGELPGLPSTVLDLTGSTPVVLREGAVPAAAALARVESSRGQ
jgi:L-threonylcarbamoyladenylate synthase